MSAATPSSTRTREPYVIVLSAGLWRGCDVLIEPPAMTHPVRHFSNHGAALTYAEELSRVEGWPVNDRVGAAS